MKTSLKYILPLAATYCIRANADSPTHSTSSAFLPPYNTGRFGSDNQLRQMPPCRSTSASSTSIILPGEIDAEEYYSKSTFPIAPVDLIARAKEVLSPQVGIGTKDDGKCLADDFEFCAAVVGPIPKEDYLGALKSFSLDVSFDIQQNYFGFYVDPLQTNRVWFFTRQMAKHVADFAGVKPTGKELELPPQLMHLDFNGDGLVKEFGFYTVDRRQGNTGGLGGAFGYFYGVGKPLPIREAMPYVPSFRFKMLQRLGALAKKFRRPAKAS